MNNAYQPEVWKEFYMMLGGCIAALTGLLFVATSLRVAEIAKTPHFRVRAFGNTFALVGQVIASALVIMPQSVMWLGIELTFLNTLLFLIIQVRFHITWARAGEQVGLLRSSLGLLGGMLGILGGTSLIVQFGGGLYLCAFGALILTWVVIWNAFSMMMDTDTDS